MAAPLRDQLAARCSLLLGFIDREDLPGRAAFYFGGGSGYQLERDSVEAQRHFVPGNSLLFSLRIWACQRSVTLNPWKIAFLHQHAAQLGLTTNEINQVELCATLTLFQQDEAGVQ